MQGVDTFAETIKNIASCTTVAGATLTACAGAVAPYALLLGSAMYLGNVASKHAKIYDYNSISTTFGTTTTGSANNSYNPDIFGSRFDFNPSRNRIEKWAKFAISFFTSQIHTITKTVTNKYDNRKSQSVYLLYDPNNNNQIEYVGRTENIEDRRVAHKSKNSPRKHLEMLPIAVNIPYEAARGLEQLGIEYYNTLNPVYYGGSAYNNQINGISTLNPMKIIFMADAIPYVSKLIEVMEENNLQKRE